MSGNGITIFTASSEKKNVDRYGLRPQHNNRHLLDAFFFHYTVHYLYWKGNCGSDPVLLSICFRILDILVQIRIRILGTYSFRQWLTDANKKWFFFSSLFCLLLFEVVKYINIPIFYSCYYSFRSLWWRYSNNLVQKFARLRHLESLFNPLQVRAGLFSSSVLPTLLLRFLFSTWETTVLIIDRTLSPLVVFKIAPMWPVLTIFIWIFLNSVLYM